MKLEIGAILNGFKVERVRKSAELCGTFYEFKHIKTGASLCWLDNGCSNKLFCIGFKTIPEDSTGVFHILEHSVLCGSDKYPVKEPFGNLMRSSLNTFLNAMTFADKTIYPVSSRNDSDFLNLTSVYLDAVFAPKCVEDPNAFRQEGWRLELDGDGKPFINGVVYNEMKGATSDADSVLEDGMNALLFPDNCYGFNSGGEPKNIPDLTYEQYKAMYDKYYHPSNSITYLDGDVPLEKTLAMIDEYMSAYKPREAIPPIPHQVNKPSKNTLYYEIGKNEPVQNRDIVCFGKLLCSFDDKLKYMMASVLCDYLANNNDSPIKRAILDAGLGEDVDLDCSFYTMQYALTLTVRNTSADNTSEIRRVVEETVFKLLESGLDRSMLTAYLNRFAFRLNDMEEPAGLFRCIMSYQGSFYGGDSLLYVENKNDVERVRAEIENGSFDALLRELMLDFDNMSVLTVLPSKTLGEEKLRLESELARSLYSSLDEAAAAALKKENDRLHRWQEEPDSAEDTAKLPTLPLSEVDSHPVKIPTEEYSTDGVRTLFHSIPSNGITHVSLYFNISDVSVKKLPMVGVMARLLSKLPTKLHDASELQKLIKTYIGRISFSIKASSVIPETCTPYFCVSFDVLDENLAKAEEIVLEILNETRFDDASRINEIVLQLNEQNKQRLLMDGHSIGVTAVNSHYLASSVVTDATSGYTFMGYVKELANDFEVGSAALVSLMENVRGQIFAKSRLIISVTSSDKHDISAMVSGLAVGTPCPAMVRHESPLPKRFGIRIPAAVSFAEKGILVPSPSGAMRVASRLISLDHLWNKVRVQGGAYGVGIRINENGSICHFTYRDPSPARSIGVFAEDSAFLKSFCESEEDLNNYIIATIGGTEPLRTPAETGDYADQQILCGKTYEDAVRHRSEILSANKEKLLELCRVFDNCAENGAMCVVGSEAALAEFSDMPVFDI